MASIEERVQLGLKYLDETFDDWDLVFREQELDLEIYSSNLHILARVSGYDFNMSYRTYFDDGNEEWLYERGFFPRDDSEIELLNEEWKTQVEMRRMKRRFQPVIEEEKSPTITQGDLFNE